MTSKDSEAELQRHTPDVSEPPPIYQEVQLDEPLENVGVTDDGRIEINANSQVFRVLSRFIPDFNPTVAQAEYSSVDGTASQDDVPPSYEAPPDTKTHDETRAWSVRLNIVIQIVGSRGDVQPFVALAVELKRWGHRVRLATHSAFQELVTSSGIDFFPLGGDPADLMAYMVKNPGLIPSMRGLRDGEIKKKRRMIAEILDGCWRSCLDPDPQTQAPFVADAIIANPPSFGHIHCSQALGIPLHLMFTMPWSSTRAFPHPLANLRQSDHASQSQGTTNFISYSMVEWMTWQGVGDVVNDWRKSLDLEPVPMSEGPGLADTLKVPFTYCWSPALIPRPEDWGRHIDVCGFFFREVPPYVPPPELSSFLEGGSRPIYIGFGSIVIDDPAETTALLVAAAKSAGVRAVISRGWSQLGGSCQGNEDVYFIDDCPHEWLFQQVSVVVHHGGAGTTACGLRYGRPTIVVPFFGDQPFWGAMIAAAGAGPAPIPYRSLDQDRIVEGIRFCLRPETQAAARDIARKMSRDTGVKSAVRSFHANLPLPNLPCDILKDLPAVCKYRYKDRCIKLSGVAGQVLLDHLKVDGKKLDLYGPSETVIENQRWDPVTSTASAAMGTYYAMFASIANIVLKPAKVYRSARDAKVKTLPDLGLMAGTNPTGGQLAERQPLSSPETLRRSRSTGDMAGGSTPSATGSEASQSFSANQHDKGQKLAASMALASASGVGDFFKSYSKGVFVDIPLAFAEGSRALPRLYGEQVRDYGTVTDWKSGLLVSGKSLFLGLGEGFADLAVKPVEGAMRSGVTGGVLGIAKGFLGFSTKVSSAAFGIVAYPSLGVYKSVRSMVKNKNRKLVMRARLHEAAHRIRLSRASGGDEFRVDAILEAFDKWKADKPSDETVA